MYYGTEILTHKYGVQKDRMSWEFGGGCGWAMVLGDFHCQDKLLFGQ